MARSSGVRAAVAAAAAMSVLAAAACSTIPRYDAAQDVHAFLVAVRDGDREAFERHVDRDALKLQMRSRFISETAGAGRGSGLATLAVAVAAPLANLAVDALVRPDTFRAAAIRLGYDPARPIPSALQMTPFIKPLGDGAACVTETHGGPCVFDFRNEAGVWRLSGYEGPLETGKLRGR